MSDLINNFEENETVEEDIVDVELDNLERAKRQKLAEVEKRSVPNLNRTRSKIYKYFTWIHDDRQWRCNYCRKQYNHSATGGAPALINHLKSTHASLITAAGGWESLLNTSEEGIKKFVVSTPRQPVIKRAPLTEEGFKEKLLKFILLTDQPFNITENLYFKQLVEYISINPEKTPLPTDSTTKRWMEDHFKKEKAKLMEELGQNKGKISFTLDCWTSSNQHAFLGVIASWINNEWKLCHTPIDLAHIEGSHTGRNIASTFSSVLDEFNLWPKVLSVTTDNASNMDTMFSHLDILALEKGSEFVAEDYRVRCLAHIINLSCQDIIKNVGASTIIQNPEDSADDEAFFATQESTFIEKIRYAIRIIRSSPQRREMFKKFAEQDSLSDAMLILDVPTRWNSTLYMIERVIKYKKPFLNTVAKLQQLRSLNLEDHIIWERLTILLNLLSPYEEATKMLSQGHSPSLPDTSTVYQFLFAHLEKYIGKLEKKFAVTRHRCESESYPDWIKNAAEEGWNKLAKYYDSCDALVYVVATVMDPRYKLQWFKVCWRKEYADGVKKTVTQIWNVKYKTVQNDDANLIANDGGTRNISALLTQKLERYTNHDDELKRYLTENLMKAHQVAEGIEGALDWWKGHEMIYPQLSHMAKDFLSACSTGVSVERLFSMGPDLLSHRRQRLNPETIKKVVCLKQWIKRKDKKDDFYEAVLDKLLLVLD